MEQAHNNIDVTLVCPGPVYSKIAEEAFTGKADKVAFLFIRCFVVCPFFKKFGNRRNTAFRCNRARTGWWRSDVRNWWCTRLPTSAEKCGSPPTPSSFSPTSPNTCRISTDGKLIDCRNSTPFLSLLVNNLIIQKEPCCKYFSWHQRKIKENQLF